MPAKRQTLTIESGDTTSDAMNVEEVYTVTIYPPSAFTGTITVQVSGDGGATYMALQSDGSDVTVTASKALVITSLAADRIRFVSGSSEDEDRAIVVAAREPTRS